MVYVSAKCAHSRSLIKLVERTGFADAYSFVNVDTARGLPPYVDRVPLMFDGTNVVTDERLFDLFSGASGSSSARAATNADESAPVNALGSAFASSFGRLDGSDISEMGGIQSQAAWLHDTQKIETPDSEPFPSKED